jgi:hypothetical protein
MPKISQNHKLADQFDAVHQNLLQADPNPLRFENFVPSPNPTSFALALADTLTGLNEWQPIEIPKSKGKIAHKCEQCKSKKESS